MQCACAILSSVASPALQFFYTLYHKRYVIFEKKKLLGINVWFDYLYNFCLKHFLL